jgi:hypothetical protein
MTTMIGTSHFVSLMRALAYYEPYGLDAADVKAKIEAGEIHIGKPTTKPGETLRLNDEGRYIIHDDLSPAERNTLNMADLTFAALAGAPVHSPAEPAYLHPMNLFRNAESLERQNKPAHTRTNGA